MRRGDDEMGGEEGGEGDMMRGSRIGLTVMQREIRSIRDSIR